LNPLEKNSRLSRLANFLAPAVVIVVCFFGQLGAIGLVGPDEPRYAWIARAMAETGDWVTPRLYGQPWFEKPILYYWSAAIGFRLHLGSAWAARLPSAFAALAAAYAIAWMERRFYRNVAWFHGGEGHKFLCPGTLGALIFAASVAGIGFARAATPDMLFSAAITLAMASAAFVLETAGALRSNFSSAAPVKRNGAAALVLFGAFVGFGVLAKGPAAILLAGGALALWALATKQWSQAARLAHPLAIGAFCVVALPWYVICALRNPDFLPVFILQHNFERYLTPVFQHRQPFWFFAEIVPLALLPWTALLWPAATEGLRLWGEKLSREKSWHNSPGFFLACWAVFPAIFFSFSESKLPGYILPAIPPLALLCAVALARTRFKSSSTDSARPDGPDRAKVALCVGSTWMALGVAAVIAMRRVPEEARMECGVAILLLAIIAFAGGLGVAALGWRRKREFVTLALLLVVLCTEIANVSVLPALDPYISARWHAQFLRNDAHPDRIFVYQLPRAWNYGLAFYMRRELPEWSPSDPNPALVLTTSKGLAQMRTLGRFEGELDEAPRGVLYVPIAPAPHR
jgi:4-amino-4-deoxy-L-arabinose transferase-like glycosyltransferase